MSEGTSLEAQWFRIHLLVQVGYPTQSGYEDPTRLGATKPTRQKLLSLCCNPDPAQPETKLNKYFQKKIEGIRSIINANNSFHFHMLRRPNYCIYCVYTHIILFIYQN